MDDIRNWLNGVKKGWRWNTKEERMEYREEWLEEDREANKTWGQRTASVLLTIYNSLMPELQCTTELPEEYAETPGSQHLTPSCG